VFVLFEAHLNFTLLNVFSILNIKNNRKTGEQNVIDLINNAKIDFGKIQIIYFITIHSNHDNK